MQPWDCGVIKHRSPLHEVVEGTVALAEARTWWTDALGRDLDREGQFGERVGEAGGWRRVGPEVVEAPAEVLDKGMSGHDDPGGSIALQPSHRSKSGLEASVVGLERVVRIDLGAMEGRREQLVEDPGVDPVPVGCDLYGAHPGAADRLVEEPHRGTVPPRREEHVDDLAELIDRPEQVSPGPTHLHVGLIHVPAISDDVPAGPGRLGELRREALDPPVYGDVVDLDPALG